MPALNQDGLEIVDAPANLNADGFEIVEPSPRPAFNPITTAERLTQAPYDFRPVSPEGWTPKAEREFRMSVLPTPEQEAAAGQGVAGATAASFPRAAVTGMGEFLKGSADLSPAAPFGDVPPLFLSPENQRLQQQQAGEAEYWTRQATQSPAERLREIQAHPAYRFGEALVGGAQEAFPVAPEQEKRFLVKTGEAAGGLVPLVGSGSLAPVTIGLQSLGAHLGNDFEQLKSEGMSENEAAKATLDRALRSAVAAGTIFTLLPEPLRKLGDRYLIDKFGETALKRFVAARAAGAAEGAVLMPTAHAAENVISGRPPTEGLGESAVAGALMIAPMKRGLTETERAFEPGLAPPPAALADAQARAAARPGEYDWQGFTQPVRPSRLTPQIGVPAARPPAAYEFATPTETRNEPAPINEPVPVEPGPLRQFPALSQPVELGGKRYEKRGAIWFENPRAADGGTPIFRDSSEGRNLIQELERKLTGAAKPPPAYDLEPVVVHADSPDSVLQKAAQRVLYGTGAVEVYSPQGVQLPLGNYLRDIAERRRLGLPLEKTSISEQLDALRKGKPSAISISQPANLPGEQRAGGLPGVAPEVRGIGQGPAPVKPEGPPPPAPPVAPPTPPAPTPVKLTPPDLEPALRVKGQKPLTGGWNHEAIMMANADNPDVLQAFGQDSNHIFVDKQGNEYTRAQAAERLGLKDPLNSETLREMQGIPKPKKPTPPPAAAPLVETPERQARRAELVEKIEAAEAKLSSGKGRDGRPLNALALKLVRQGLERAKADLEKHNAEGGVPSGAKEEKGLQVEPPKPAPAAPVAPEGPLSGKALEDKLITDSLKGLADIFMPPPEPPGGPTLRHSGGPDTARAVEHLKNLGRGLYLKTERNFELWKTEVIKLLGPLAERIQNLTSLLRDAWSGLGQEFPAPESRNVGQFQRGRVVASPANKQGPFAQVIRDWRDAINSPEAIKHEQDVADARAERRHLEAMPPVETTADPEKQFGTWVARWLQSQQDRPKIGPKAKQAKINAARWLLGNAPHIEGFGKRADKPGVWPELAYADITKLTPNTFDAMAGALAQINSRHIEGAGKSRGERAVTYSSVADAKEIFVTRDPRSHPGALDMAVKQGVLPTNPAARLFVDIDEGPRVAEMMRLPTDEDAVAIVGDMPNQTAKDYARTMMEIPFRPNDLLADRDAAAGEERSHGLRWSRIHLTGNPEQPGYIDLEGRRNKVPGKETNLQLTAEGESWLAELKRRRNPSNDPNAEVFDTTRELDVLERRKLNEAVRRSVERLGLLVPKAGVDLTKFIDKINNQVFRKIFITYHWDRIARGESSLTQEDVAQMAGNTVNTINKDYKLMAQPKAVAKRAGKAGGIFAEKKPQATAEEIAKREKGSAEDFGLNIPSGTSAERLVEPATGLISYVTYLNPSRLVESRDVPQFKIKTKPLTGPWRPAFAGDVLVWQRANGDLETISGRHRLAHSKKQNVAKLKVQILKETEGWTLGRVKLLDAIANAVDNQGSPRDFARRFRDPDVIKEIPDDNAARESGLLREGSNAATGWIIGRDGTDALYERWFGDTDPDKAKDKTRPTPYLTDEVATTIARLAPRDEQKQRFALAMFDEGGIGAEDIADAFQRRQAREASLAAKSAAESSQAKFPWEADEAALEAARSKAANQIVGKIKKQVSELNAMIRLGKVNPGELQKFDFKTGRMEEVTDLRNHLSAELLRWEKWYLHDDLDAQVRQATGESPIPPGPAASRQSGQLTPAEAREYTALRRLDQAGTLPDRLRPRLDELAARGVVGDLAPEATGGRLKPGEFRETLKLEGEQVKAPKPSPQLDLFASTTIAKPSYQDPPIDQSEIPKAFRPEDAAGFPVRVMRASELEAKLRDLGYPEAEARDVARTSSGLFLPDTREIVLISDAIAQSERGKIAAVVREEAGHGLLRSLDANRMLAKILADGKLQLTEAERAPLRELGYEDWQHLDEFIAKSAAENLPWWKAAVEQVRVWLSKVGLANLTNAEVSRMLVKELRRMNARGTVSTEESPFGGIAASRTKDEDLYGQIMGIDRAAGPMPNDPAAIGVKKIIRENLEKDSTWSTAGAPTPEKTAQVWDTLKSLMSLPTAEGKLQQLSDAAAQGAPDNMRYAISQMAGGQYVRGAFHYALRLAAQRRDPSLLYFIGERYNEINTTTGPQAPRGLGRAFNALQAGEADPLFRSWLALLDAADDVKLSGKDKLRQLVQIMHEHGDIIEEISKKGPDEIVPAAREELRKKALTPELAWLRQYQDALESYNTEWKKPKFRQTLLGEIKALIKRFETTQPFARAVADNGAGFRSTLSDLLFDKVVESIEVENARREKINEDRRNKAAESDQEEMLDEEGGGIKEIPLIDLEDPDLIAVLRRQMEDLSFDIWHKKLAKEGDWISAARNLDEQWTKATLDKWEREQTDWLKPTKERSRAQKEVESFLDLPPFENTDAERKQRVDALRAKLESVGVLPNTAWAMADAAWNRKLRNESNEHLRQIQREQQRIWNESEGVARSLIAGMQNLQTSNTVRNRVRELVTQALRIRPTSDDIAKLGALEASRQIDAISKEPSSKLIEELTKPMAEGGGGLDEATARELATLVATKREFMWRSANRQAMERAANSQRLTGLMEAILASPHQAQSDPAWRFATARDWFISNGLSKTEAAEAARIFAAEFNTRLDEAAKKVAERVLAGFNFDRPTKLSVVQAVRSGLMDPNKPWWAEFAEKGGLKLPTEAQLKKLAELDERLSKLQPDEEFDITEINSQMSQIFRQLQPPPKFWNLIAANFVVAPLTGIRTLTIQAGPWFWQPYEALLTSLTRPHDLANTWKPVIDGFRGMISQFRFGMSADAHSFLANKFGGAVNELEHLWKTGLEDVKNKNPLIRSRGLLKMLTGGQMFSMRALDSFDQASGVMLRYGLMLRYGQSVFRNAGMDSRDIRNLSEFARAVHHAKYLDLVNGRPDEGIPPETHVRASVHADQFTTAQVQEFMVNKLTEHLESSIEPNDPARVQKLASAMNTATVEAQKARDAAEFDARQAIGRLGEGVREEEEGGVMSRLFLHPLLKVSSQLRRGTPQERILAVALLGYLNIPIRTARYFAWNSPYGLARLGIHGYRQWRGFDNWWKQSLANEHMVQYRLRQALAATALQAAITATGIAYFGQSSSADDNAKKNGFFITGQGPKNAAVRDAWLKVGFRPYSIMLFHDGKPATVPLMRLGEPLSHLFILLSALDDYNWRKKEKEATGKQFSENAIQSAGYLIGNYIGALGQRGLIYTTARLTRAAGSEGGAAKVAADIVSGAVANATPFIGMQRSILGMMMGQVDQSSIQSTIESNFPIFGALGVTHQAVNRFGDPLGNRTWYAKMADTGVPIAFQVADNDENHRLYMDMVQKGVGPPALRRAIIEEKYGQLTDAEWSTFAQRSGDLLKKTTLANLSTIERQSPADAKKTLSGFAATADNIAARGLGLETVATAKTGGGGVSLPSSSGSSGGLLGGGAGLLGGGGGILSGGGGRLLGGSRAGGLGGGGGGLRAARTTRVRSVGLRRRSVTRRLRIPRRSLGGSRSRRRLLGGLRRPRMRRLRLA